MKITCRECWRVHETDFDCYAGVKATPSDELAKRREALYAKAYATREAPDLAEAWRHAQKAGVPYAAIAKLRQGPSKSTALAAAREFNKDSQALFLLLLGPTGVGKTLAAALVVVDFASKWPWNLQPLGGMQEPIRWVDSVTLTRLSAFDDEAKRYVEALKACHLLVLEDAGDEGTELGRGVFVELLMARHAKGRRTVITANLRPPTFRGRYGAAVADRIRESGYMPNLFGETSRRTPKLEVVKTTNGEPSNASPT